jgi:cytochrome bd-type quinol oxidase subunit 2
VIEWFTMIAIIVCILAGLTALVLGGIGHQPDDYSVLPTAAVALVLIVQIVIGIVAPFVGHEPTGDLVEWWIYLVVAVVLPVAAIVWALIDRTRWATVVMGVASLSVAVMIYRKLQIWCVQGSLTDGLT